MRTLEKREEKIRKLASANQEANLALKAMEQKAASTAAVSLTSAAAAENAARKSCPKHGSSSLRELDMLMQRLKACRSPKEDLLVACFPGSIPEDAGLPPQIKRRLSHQISARQDNPLLSAALCVASYSTLSHPGERILGRQHLPLDLFLEMMETPVLVVSAHAGDTFLGVAMSREGFEVKELVESQVKEKHSKGGWSQKRFERLREEDIKNHVDAVLEKLSGLLAKYGTIVKYAVLGGDESLIRQITPAIGLPMVERRLEPHDEKELDSLLEEVYGFTCYRIEI